jgi:hypothetical protein
VRVRASFADFDHGALAQNFRQYFTQGRIGSLLCRRMAAVTAFDHGNRLTQAAARGLLIAKDGLNVESARSLLSKLEPVTSRTFHM